MHEGGLHVVDVDGGVHDVPGIIVRGMKSSPLPSPQRRERLMQPSLHLGESGTMVFVSGEIVPLVGIIRDVVEFFIAVGVAEVAPVASGEGVAAGASSVGAGCASVRSAEESAVCRCCHPNGESEAGCCGEASPQSDRKSSGETHRARSIDIERDLRDAGHEALETPRR